MSSYEFAEKNGSVCQSCAESMPVKTAATNCRNINALITGQASLARRCF